jgi:nitrile hydratase
VRMPAYIRGQVGVVVAESPPYPFPDAHAHGVPPKTSRPTTSASAPPSCGRARPTRPTCTSACFQSYLERAPG